MSSKTQGNSIRDVNYEELVAQTNQEFADEIKRILSRSTRWKCTFLKLDTDDTSNKASMAIGHYWDEHDVTFHTQLYYIYQATDDKQIVTCNFPVSFLKEFSDIGIFIMEREDAEKMMK